MSRPAKLWRARDVVTDMASLYISAAPGGNDQIVRRPRPTDAIGAALRGVFGEGAALPPDMMRLLQKLDRTPDA